MSADGARTALYRSLVLDVDSTLAGVEGIDELARAAGPEVAARVARLTAQAMDGELRLESVYGERLRAIRPTAADVADLAQLYRARVAPGAARALRVMRACGVRPVLVSGGLRQAILPLAEELGFAPPDVHAVDVLHSGAGDYAGFDEQSPLVTQNGKADVVRSLDLPRPVLAVGDGATDAAMRVATDAFAAFTGFVRREAIVQRADLVVSTFDELLEVVCT